MVLWDQITGSWDEVTTWLDTTVHKLEDDAGNFADATSAQVNLHKYKVGRKLVYNMSEKSEKN